MCDGCDEGRGQVEWTDRRWLSSPLPASASRPAPTPGWVAAFISPTHLTLLGDLSGPPLLARARGIQVERERLETRRDETRLILVHCSLFLSFSSALCLSCTPPPLHNGRPRIHHSRTPSQPHNSGQARGPHRTSLKLGSWKRLQRPRLPVHARPRTSRSCLCSCRVLLALCSRSLRQGHRPRWPRVCCE